MSQQHYAAAYLFTTLLAGAYAKLFIIKDTQHDSKLQGKDYYEEVMSTCNKNRFFEVARMPYESFIKFVNWKWKKVEETENSRDQRNLLKKTAVEEAETSRRVPVAEMHLDQLLERMPLALTKPTEWRSRLKTRFSVKNFRTTHRCSRMISHTGRLE